MRPLASAQERADALLPRGDATVDAGRVIGVFAHIDAGKTTTRRPKRYVPTFYLGNYEIQHGNFAALLL